MVWGLIKPDYQSSLGGGVPGYEFWAGTSMATPAAAGALAHMWRYQPSFTNQQIIDYLEHHAAPEGTNPNIGYGWGYLDMSLVMDGLMSDYPYLHAPALTTPATVPVGPNFITWNAVTGHSVVYNVSVDGSLVATLAGTSAGVTLTQGLHTYAVQATSLLDWYDGSSTATGTIFASTTAGAMPTDSWGEFQPAGWVNTRTVPVSVQARDATSGLLLGTAEYQFSSDGGSTWSSWSPASFSYSGGPTATQTISATVQFTQDSSTASDQVEFRVTNAASLVGTSPAFPVQVDSIAPTGTFTVAGGLSTVTTTTVSVESSVTDVNLDQMRFSGDTAAPWTTWLPYSADATITLPPGRTTKTVRAEYRDKALNVLAQSRPITLLIPTVVRRVAGYNRYDTTIQISRAHFATGTADTVVVATGENFPDALSAAALAGSYSAPLLLTSTDTLWSGIPGEISRLGATRAIIVGGPPAVSAGVELQLDRLPGVSVTRFQGADRYATSAAIAAEVKRHELELGNAFANEAFLARGDAFPDALAASPLAFARRIPILLVKPTEIPPVIWTQIVTLMPNVSTAHLVVCGGTGAVESGVTNQLTKAGRKWLRVGSPPGGTRYDTAAAMAAYGVGRGWATWQFVGVATGEDFPDALGGGVAAGKMGGLVLLTQTASASPACVNALPLQTFFVDELDVFGGTTAVSAAAYNTIHGLF
jgi:putative cell wall-binding protein